MASSSSALGEATREWFSDRDLQKLASTWSAPMVTAVVVATYTLIFILVRVFGPYRPSRTPGWDTKTRLDANTRVVGFVNIGVCLFTCGRLLADPATFEALTRLEEAAFGTSPVRDFYLLVVAAYMIYDMAIVVYFYRAIGDPLMIVHHVVIIVAIQVGVQHRAATFYIAVLFMNELSTIFLNTRYLLLHMGRKDSSIYIYNGIALVLSFFFSRILPIFLLLLHAAYAWWVLAFVEGLYWERPWSDRLLFGGLTALLLSHFVLNCFWFHKIVAAARRGLRRFWDADQKEQ